MDQTQVLHTLLERLIQKQDHQVAQSSQLQQELRTFQNQSKNQQDVQQKLLLAIESQLLSSNELAQDQELRLSQQHEDNERHLKGLLNQLSQAATDHQQLLSQTQQATEQIKSHVTSQQASSAQLSQAASYLNLKMWASMLLISTILSALTILVWDYLREPQLNAQLIQMLARQETLLSQCHAPQTPAATSPPQAPSKPRKTKTRAKVKR